MQKTSQQGFTLIEVLIAITITALIGVGTYSIFSSTITTQEGMQVRGGQLQQLQRAMTFISRDMEQLGTRPVRNEYGDYEFAISNRNNLYWMELSRLGWRNPLRDPRSDVQRVAYELRDTELVREYWQVLDRAQDSQPVSQVLLDGVEKLGVRFMDEKNDWHEEWPTDNVLNLEDVQRYTALPKAVEITLTHQRFGKLVRVYDVAGFYNSQQSSSDDSNSNSNNNSNTDNSDNLSNEANTDGESFQ